MAKTISELKAQSAEVKNASAIGENTATRVGQLFGDIVEHVEQYENTKNDKDVSQDAQMQSLVSAEESRAKGEERGLQNQIHAEKIDRQTADTYLSNLIQQESSARETADENIRAALANETARAQAAEQELAAAQIYTAKIKDGAVTTPKIADGAVTYEKTDIIAQELGTNITKVPSQKVVTDAVKKEETERKADVNGLTVALASETINREQGDENLNAAIEAEAEARNNAVKKEETERKADVNGLTAALASETINREQGDENLNAAIEAEAEARDNAINNEAQARSRNDALLNQAIVAEKDRAEAREQELTAAIQQETERAEAAEEANATAINAADTKNEEQDQKLSELDQKVNDVIGGDIKKELKPTTILGGYYRPSSGTELIEPTNMNVWHTDAIDISAFVGGKVLVTCSGKGKGTGRYTMITDDGGTILASKHEAEYVLNEDGTASCEFDIANGAKYLYISYIKTYNLVSVTLSKIGENIKDVVAQHTQDLVQLNTFKESVSGNLISKQKGKPEVTWGTGYINSFGKVTGQTLTHYQYSSLIHLRKGDKISVTSSDPSSTSVKRLTRFTKEDVFIEVITTGTKESTTYEYTAQETDEYVRLSIYNLAPYDWSVESLVIPDILHEAIGAEASAVVDKKISELEIEDNRYWAYAMWKILCIGDSLTSGAYCGEEWGAEAPTGASIDQNYPRILGRMICGEVTNGGFSGASASTYYENRLSNFTLGNYDTFVIWLGTNNGLTDTLDTDVNPYTDYTQFANTETGYYCKIIAKIKESVENPLIILNTVFASKGNVATTNAVIQKIADKYGLIVIDMTDISHTLRPELHCNVSNPHFGKAGNIVIADRIIKVVAKYIEESPIRAEFGITNRTN